MFYLYNRINFIIYCDFKLRNIILIEDKELKVGDFGLSKLINVECMYDVYKMMGEMGSYRYMVFEVFEYKVYDNFVDVFFFVMMLYEMFEGLVFFDDKEVYEVVILIVIDECWLFM